jgi:hypothetical protein
MQACKEICNTHQKQVDNQKETQHVKKGYIVVHWRESVVC